MKVHVRLFARAKDLAGAESVTLELPHGACARDLRRGLANKFPALTGLVERCALAVDNEFAGDERLLTAEAEIALLPPVSGG